MKTEQFVLVNAWFYGTVFERENPDLGLMIEGNRIVDICHVSKIPAEIRRVDMQGCRVAPGFIDLLANGAGGGSFGATADYADLQLMADTMLKEGTTGFLAAAPSNSLEMYLRMQDALEEQKGQLPVNFMGLHLEGPYFSYENRGAHREECLRDCTDEELHALFDKENAFVCMMSVAPERITDAQLSYLESKGVKVSFAHSAASYDDTLRFLEKEHRSVTHLYNGMPTMHHRKPGHIPAIFHAKPMTGIIVDGVHVAYEMVKMAYEIMPDSLYLFTDRFTDCAAMNVSYDSSQDCCIRQDAGGNKVLCGSALSMIKAVRNCVEHIGIPLDEAVVMASYQPATVLGIERHVGLLEPDYVANLVAFDDNWQVQRVMVNGEWVYEK